MSQALYHMIATRRSGDRPVNTPRGPGQLEQVFRGRVCVLLNEQADEKKPKLAFFEPGEVTVAETKK